MSPHDKGSGEGGKEGGGEVLEGRGLSRVGEEEERGEGGGVDGGHEVPCLFCCCARISSSCFLHLWK